MIRNAPVAALALLCACTSSNLAASTGEIPAGRVIAGEFIIEADLAPAVLADLGLEKVDYDAALHAGLYRAPQGVSLTAMQLLLRDSLPTAVHVEENRTVSALASDPWRSLQWNLDLLDVERAWATSDGTGAIVAVIDTGVSSFGEDAPDNLLQGWDFVDNDNDPSDENGHGTHVAGTIAQATGNGVGVAGVAPGATILPLRVLDARGTGSVYWSASALRYAADEGADVANLSLGSPYSSSVERTAVDYARSKGVVVVAASGNDGKGTVDYPGAYEGVISVGAVGASSQAAPYSNGGSALDLVAPGGDMSRDRNGDGYADGILQETLDGGGTSYQFFEGTSMATPHVAAAAAILVAAGARGEQVEALLIDTAQDLGSSGWDSWTGNGMVDINAALDALGAQPGGSDPTEPEPTDTTAPVISGVSGTRSGTSMTITWTTDEASSTEIDFRDFGLFGDPAERTTQHSLSFTVDASATYYFTVISEDDAGNRTEDGVWYLNP